MRTLSLALLLLGACAEDTDLDAALPVDEAPIPVLLTSTGTCPGTVTFTMSGLTPGAPWGLAVSPNLAPGVPIPSGPCAGLTWLRIGPPASLGASGTASAAGTASVTATLGPASCSWYLQAVDIGSCTTSAFIQP